MREENVNIHTTTPDLVSGGVRERVGKKNIKLECCEVQIIC